MLALIAAVGATYAVGRAGMWGLGAGEGLQLEVTLLALAVAIGCTVWACAASDGSPGLVLVWAGAGVTALVGDPEVGLWLTALGGGLGVLMHLVGMLGGSRS